MQESCPYGSVRGAPSNGCPYRNRRDAELVGHITDVATEPGKERLTHLL
jgi:hypothetical protein